MLKTALFDCTINEKCCSFDGGGAFALFFRPYPGELTPQESPPPGICHPRQKKKNEMPGGQQGGGGGASRSWN